tara:strand:+ start:537 stop:740 length:204 start_codon:yes stop_codon:yes gene_type:complete
MQVVEVVENGVLNPHHIIQVPLDQVVEVQEQLLNQMQVQALQILVVVEADQVMVLIVLLLVVQVDQE